MKHRKDTKAVNEVKIALRRAPIVLAVVAVSCAIAACGSSSSSSSSNGSSGATTTTTASSSNGSGFAARRAKLAACLKQHGVTLPQQFRRPPGSRAAGSGAAQGSGAQGSATPGSGTQGSATPGSGAQGYGAPPGGFQPGNGGRLFRGRAPSAKLQAAFKACGANFGARAGRFRTLARANITKYVTCVRQHGYNLPAPNFSGNGPIFPASIRTNKKFQAASRSCASLLTRPSAGSASGSGSTASS